MVVCEGDVVESNRWCIVKEQRRGQIVSVGVCVCVGRCVGGRQRRYDTSASIRLIASAITLSVGG